MDTSLEFLFRAGQADTADTLREYAERRLSFALGRFAQESARLGTTGPAIGYATDGCWPPIRAST
jgi:hypothetical protein